MLNKIAHLKIDKEILPNNSAQQDYEQDKELSANIEKEWENEDEELEVSKQPTTKSLAQKRKEETNYDSTISIAEDNE